MADIKVGIKVDVFDASNKERLGTGTIVGLKVLDILGYEVETPEIKMDNGETVFGYECWWSPTREI